MRKVLASSIFLFRIEFIESLEPGTESNVPLRRSILREKIFCQGVNSSKHRPQRVFLGESRNRVRGFSRVFP